MKPVTDFSHLKESLRKSLKDFDTKELNEMRDDLCVLIDLLIHRQIAVEEVILDRLDNAFYSTPNQIKTQS